MDIIAEISKLQQEKKKNEIVPNHVTEIELISEICRNMRIELNRLKQEGVITEFRTLNDKAYIVND
ncbi:hypothetical protein [uncultured Parabacteroides sp.]|uniref:hypothetical protein n=1 Tax=uncultured Parabacteroides sp. TaxID=512312 RepID=UPI0026DD49E4|nr:hypothetical protein [uncultured Parabacteroides sp.]